jgi:hypothetical protein
VKSWEDQTLFPVSADHKRLAELNSGRHPTPTIMDDGRVLLGVGRRVQSQGLNDAEIDLMLYHDLQAVRRQLLGRYPWTLRLDPIRFAALQELGFLVGLGQLGHMTQLLYRLETDDYAGAAHWLSKSVWSVGTPEVSRRLQLMLATGEWPWTPLRADQQPTPPPFSLAPDQ